MILCLWGSGARTHLSKSPRWQVGIWRLAGWGVWGVVSPGGRPGLVWGTTGWGSTERSIIIPSFCRPLWQPYLFRCHSLLCVKALEFPRVSCHTRSPDRQCGAYLEAAASYGWWSAVPEVWSHWGRWEVRLTQWILVSSGNFLEVFRERAFCNQGMWDCVGTLWYDYSNPKCHLPWRDRYIESEVCLAQTPHCFQ